MTPHSLSLILYFRCNFCSLVETETTVSFAPRVKNICFPTLILRSQPLSCWWLGRGSSMRAVDVVPAVSVWMQSKASTTTFSSFCWSSSEQPKQNAYQPSSGICTTEHDVVFSEPSAGVSSETTRRMGDLQRRLFLLLLLLLSHSSTIFIVRCCDRRSTSTCTGSLYGTARCTVAFFESALYCIVICIVVRQLVVRQLVVD